MAFSKFSDFDIWLLGWQRIETSSWFTSYASRAQASFRWLLECLSMSCFRSFASLQYWYDHCAETVRGHLSYFCDALTTTSACHSIQSLNHVRPLTDSSSKTVHNDQNCTLDTDRSFFKCTTVFCSIANPDLRFACRAIAIKTDIG